MSTVTDIMRKQPYWRGENEEPFLAKWEEESPRRDGQRLKEDAKKQERKTSKSGNFGRVGCGRGRQLILGTGKGPRKYEVHQFWCETEG